MVKEAVICIIIVIAIFGMDIFTQNFTKQAVGEITEVFSKIKENILKEDKELIDKEIKNLEEKWKNLHDKLAYYIEHDELEKVDTAIVVMKSYIEVEDFDDALAELDEGKFVLEHIQKKNAFNLENVF